MKRQKPPSLLAAETSLKARLDDAKKYKFQDRAIAAYEAGLADVATAWKACLPNTIFSRMAGVVDEVMVSYQTDFWQHDMGSLLRMKARIYDMLPHNAPFAWFVTPRGTFLTWLEALNAATLQGQKDHMRATMRVFNYAETAIQGPNRLYVGDMEKGTLTRLFGFADVAFRLATRLTAEVQTLAPGEKFEHDGMRHTFHRIITGDKVVATLTSPLPKGEALMRLYPDTVVLRCVYAYGVPEFL